MSTSFGLWSVKSPLLYQGLGALITNSIWFVFDCAVVFLLYKAWKRQCWLEFRRVFQGSVLLVAWYFVHLIDEWLHQQTADVFMGYTLTTPFWEAIRLTSSVFLLWGTHAVVWRELHSRFVHPTVWWHVGYSFVLIIWLMMLFYVGLYIALAFVWLFFTGVNVISDVASKRNNFEVAFVAFQWLFSLFILVGSLISVIFWKKYDHVVYKQGWLLLGASTALMIRSLAELIIVAQCYQPDGPTRAEKDLAYEITFGIFSSIYLLLITLLAWSVANHDAADPQELVIQEDIRNWISNHLDIVTRSGREPAPSFLDVLAELKRDPHQALLAALPAQDNNPALSIDQTDNVQTKYIGYLEQRYGQLEPLTEGP